MSDPALAWVALGFVRAPEGDRFRAIHARHGSPAPLLRGDVEEPDLLPLEMCAAARAALPRARREVDAIRGLAAAAISFGDPRYPSGLREIADPPAWIALRGEAGEPDAPAVAIVGSRNASLAGEARAREWAAWLARRGVTIVSGLARGIDSAAHRGALDAGGRTIAVLGCALDYALLRRPSPLQRDIVSSGGAVLSDFPLGTSPAPWTFPRRNRVISALALGVLVMQAAARSGTLITARCAGDQGRDVWAVPGAPEDPRSRGTNALIRQGACLVEHPSEVLGDLLPSALSGIAQGPDTGAPPQAEAGLSDEERNLLAGVSREAVDIDTLAARAGLPVTRASALLVRLEVAGLVRRIEGMRFERA